MADAFIQSDVQMSYNSSRSRREALVTRLQVHEVRHKSILFLFWKDIEKDGEGERETEKLPRSLSLRNKTCCSKCILSHINCGCFSVGGQRSFSCWQNEFLKD